MNRRKLKWKPLDETAPVGTYKIDRFIEDVARKSPDFEDDWLNVEVRRARERINDVAKAAFIDPAIESARNAAQRERLRLTRRLFEGLRELRGDLHSINASAVSEWAYVRWE